MTISRLNQVIAVLTLSSVLPAAPVLARAQQPQTPQPSVPRPSPSAPATPPSDKASPQATPSPQSTPFARPSPALAIPPQTSTQTPPGPLTLDEALSRSAALSLSFQQAGLNERIAAEDVRQARVAFLPQVTAPLSYLYTSPALGLPTGTPRAPSFIANNAISEYQAYVNVAGDFDISGRLRAALEKNRALLEAAHAGTEVARRALTLAVIDAYYGLALATAQRSAAEQNLAAAEEFERITSLLFSGGEVAAVDLTRAQLQTIGRRDELERARANEEVAAGSLRVLVGYEFTNPISATDLTLALPGASEFQQFSVDDISKRPEFSQFEAQRRAATQEVKISRAERLPQLSYSILGGFDTDSLRPPRLKEHVGVSGGLIGGLASRYYPQEI